MTKSTQPGAGASFESSKDNKTNESDSRVGNLYQELPNTPAKQETDKLSKKLEVDEYYRFATSHGSTASGSTMDLGDPLHISSVTIGSEFTSSGTGILEEIRSTPRSKSFHIDMNDTSLNEIFLDSPTSPTEVKKIEIKSYNRLEPEQSEDSPINFVSPSRIHDDMKEMAPHGLHVYCCLNSVRPPSLQTSIENGVYTCEYRLQNLSASGMHRIKHLAKQDAASNMLVQLFPTKKTLREIYIEMDKGIAASDRNLKPILRGSSIDSCQLLNEVVTFYNFDKMEPHYMKEKEHYQCTMKVKYKGEEFECEALGVNPKQVKKKCASLVLKKLFPNMGMDEIREKIERERRLKESKQKPKDSQARGRNKQHKKENQNPNIDNPKLEKSDQTTKFLSQFPMSMIQGPDGKMIQVKIVPVNPDDIPKTSSIEASNLIYNPFMMPQFNFGAPKYDDK